MDPVVALDKAFELADAVGGLMGAALSQRGLTARAEVLFVLQQHGEPLVQRDLARLLRCTPRHVTALVDVLEQHGWVGRSGHPTDRRATLVGLTDRGAETAAWMLAGRHAAARELLGGIDPADLAGFVAVADRLIRHATGREGSAAGRSLS